MKKNQSCCCKFTSLFILYLLLAASACQQSDSPIDKSVKNALSTFELDSTFQIELVAIEPLVADPVAMEIDEVGRLYVVEMHGYPLDKSGTGRVKLLADTDGDGRMDESTVFADNLMLPTGILRWKKGVLVTDPPHVLYLEDTDEDNKADVRDTLLIGFAVSNPQHNFNTPVLGLDNWIYLAHEPAVTTQLYKEKFGDPGSEIFFPDLPNGPRLPENSGGRSVRFRPDTHQLEMLSSRTQFGHAFDNWGHYFLVSNSRHIYQEVVASRYLERKPELPVADATQSLPDHGDAPEVFPITTNPEHQLLTNIGIITSACGLTAYQGGVFPPAFDSVTFVAEPVNNLIHADRLTDRSTTFTASRLYPEKEFLASTDAWFRPVNMYIGPDGALYVVDYYRQIIEHPEWMAEEVVKSGALYNGTDQGRIYRITPKGTKPAEWTKGKLLKDASDEELVEALAHPNIWWRRNAQRLLLDRNSTATLPLLAQMAKNKEATLGRLHALWTLEGLGKLSPALIVQALQDPVPGNRENAIKLAELHLNEAPSLTDALLALQEDADPKVRFQLLCTLGFLDTPPVAEARQKLLFKDLQDEWVQVAALSAVSTQEDALLDAVLARFQEDNLAYASLVERLSAMSAAEEDAYRLIEKATAPVAARSAWQAPMLEGVAQGFKNKKSSVTPPEQQQQLVKAYFNHPVASVRQAALDVLKATGLSDNAQTTAAMQQAQRMADNRSLPEEKRAEALAFLALGNIDEIENFLKKLIDPAEPLSVQTAALYALSAKPDETVSQFVLEKWPVLTPELRNVAINTFMGKPERISLLLDAIEAGQVQRTSVGWGRSVGLMTVKNTTVALRARALFGEKNNLSEEVIKEYQAALDLASDPQHGQLVFEKNCAICHQMGEKAGNVFGPDLVTLKNRRPASIMADILAPNLSIADGYDLWTVTLKNGEQVQGVIGSETPTALTLRNAGGQETTIARKDIASLHALDVSAMPMGLQNQISQQEMADLLAYIREAN